MQRHDYLVITCRHFYGRHRRIFLQHHQELDAYFKLPKLVLEHDISSGLPHACNDYRPSLWESQIKYSLPLHLYNISDPGSSFHRPLDTDCVQRYATLLADSNKLPYFSPRMLSLAEHSLLHKHYEALQMCAQGRKPLLVIEDDAFLHPKSRLDFLIDHIDNLSASVGFTNLVATGRSKFSPIAPYFKLLGRAQTNTTCAYVLSPDYARVLSESFFPYSLPIDFHYQYLFFKLGLPGFTVGDDFFVNGSCSGLLPSTIQ